MTQRARSPVLGFNHNLRHRGRVFHVQTEDSGPSYARLYTHLFFEGTILSSKKENYDPAAPEDSVRLMMQQLHKAMIRELTHGGHDPHIAAFFASRGERAMDLPIAAAPPPAAAAPPPAAVEAVSAVAQPEPAAVRSTSEPSDGFRTSESPIEVASDGAPIEPLPPMTTDPTPMVVEEMPISPATAAPAPAPAASPRTPAPRPKPVVVVKPGGIKRPPVVLSSSADGVVVRRNVVIDVGGGSPPVNGTPPPARPRAPASVSVRDASYGTAATRAPEPPPQPLASSQNIHMPWETPTPLAARRAPAAPVQSPAPAAEAPAPRPSREIRMPWDPPAPGGGTDSFAADLVSDKSLDEVILEYLSDDAETEER